MLTVILLLLGLLALGLGFLAHGLSKLAHAHQSQAKVLQSLMLKQGTLIRAMDRDGLLSNEDWIKHLQYIVQLQTGRR
jgi:uncharacterized membrane protein YphA (DoxX/SURF4 family)